MTLPVTQFGVRIALLTILLIGMTSAFACNSESEPVVEIPIPTPSAISPTLTPAPTPTPTPLPPTPTATPKPDGTPVAMDASSWLENIMKLVPDTEDTREITWFQNNLPMWEYNEAHGLPRPDENDDDWSFEDYLIGYMEFEPSFGLLRMAGNPRAFIPWLSGFSARTRDHLRTHSTMGFDQRNVDSMFVAGQIMDGDLSLEGLVGSYDPEVTSAKLLACDECLEHDLVEHQGSKFYSWGEDYQGNLRKSHELPAFDLIGRGGRIAIFPGYALRTLYTAGMESLIDTVTGNSPSLWDSEGVQQVVGAMDELGMFSGIYSETDFSVEWIVSLLAEPRGTEEAAVIRERLTAQPVLLPFLAIGSGYGNDSIDQPVHGVIVILHADSETATENKLRLEERIRSGVAPNSGVPWAELAGETEIEVRGTLLLARIEILEHVRSENVSRAFNPIQLPETGPLIVTE